MLRLKQCTVMRLDVPHDRQIATSYEVEGSVDDDEVALCAKRFGKASFLLTHPRLQFTKWCIG
jgi:hypothetical protein